MTADPKKTEARRARRASPPAPAPTPQRKRLTELELAEVSCVPVPANAGARHLFFKQTASIEDAGKAAPDIGECRKWLGAAIALHERHMSGDAPTTGPEGEKSQQLMMSQMRKAMAALGGKAGGGDMPMKSADADPSPDPVAALEAQLADATATLAERDEQIAFLADRLAAVEAASPPQEQPMPEPDPAAEKAEATAKAAQDASIAKAVEAAVAKATEDLRKQAEDMRKAAEAATARAEKAEATANAEKAARELTDMTKAAEGPDFGRLPGEPVAKAKALVALAGLPDAERGTLEAMLKAGNSALAPAFREVGKGGDFAPAGGTAEAELDALAKARAAETHVPYAKAYAEVLAANPEIYRRHKAEQRARAARVVA